MINDVDQLMKYQIINLSLDVHIRCGFCYCVIILIHLSVLSEKHRKFIKYALLICASCKWARDAMLQVVNYKSKRMIYQDTRILK